MRKQIMSTLAVLGFFFTLAATSAQAQTGPLEADIPFAFNVGGKTLPAGEYRVQQMGLTQNVIAVVSRSGKDAVLSLKNNVTGAEADKSALIFRRYGNHYFLARIVTAGATTGSALPMSKAERRIREGRGDGYLARRNAAPEHVTVFAGVE
jgi:hypothetical protein